MVLVVVVGRVVHEDRWMSGEGEMRGEEREERQRRRRKGGGEKRRCFSKRQAN